MLWKSLSDAGLEAVLGIQFDGPGQVVEAVLGAPGDGVEHRQAVERVVGMRMSRPECR